MLKVGLIGRVSSIGLHLHEVQRLSGMQIIGKSSVGMIGQAEEKFLAVPELNRKELVETSDIIVVDHTPLIYPDLMVFAIKNNKHLFINDFPDLSPEEVLDLFKLAEEAKTTVFIRNPLMDEPISGWLYKNNREPSYVSFFDAEVDLPEKKSFLLKYLFYAAVFFDSQPQKIRVSGIHHPDSPQCFINIRLDYSSNSTFNLELLIQPHEEKTIKAAFPGKFLSGDLVTGNAFLNNRSLSLEKNTKGSLGFFLSSSGTDSFYQLTNLNTYISTLLTLNSLLGKIRMYTSWN
jgi:hypothetical protein